MHQKLPNITYSQVARGVNIPNMNSSSAHKPTKITKSMKNVATKTSDDTNEEKVTTEIGSCKPFNFYNLNIIPKKLKYTIKQLFLQRYIKLDLITLVGIIEFLY